MLPIALTPGIPFLNTGQFLRCRPMQSRLTLVVAIWFMASVAQAAQIEPLYYRQLIEELDKTGAAAVMVGLAVNPTLKQDFAGMEEKAKPLLSELGPEMFEASYWNNGLGQIGFYVTADGLRILFDTTNAQTFMPDTTAKMRSRVNDSDGSLDAIEAAINATGVAYVEVFLNVDEGDYDIEQDGSTTFRPSEGLSNQSVKRFNSIMAQKFAGSLQNIDTSPALAAAPSPSFLVRIDRNAFYGLRVSRDVRAIRPIGFVDPRPAQWPADALAEAQTNGSAEVAIMLRGGSIYSPKTGYMAETAIKAQSDASQRAFEDILSGAGSSLSSLALSTNFHLGIISGRIPYGTLTRLYENADPRILSITLNRPIGGIHLPPSQQSPGTPSSVSCLFKTEIHGNLSQTTLAHNLIIAENDRSKAGDVFVGFLRNSRPGELWLLTDNQAWPKYDGANPAAFAPNGIVSAGELKPVIALPIIPSPLDLTAFSGDGEIWVGYGLRNSASATENDSFQDMLNHQRYDKIWTIGDKPTIDVICLPETLTR
ncbi:MAG: hypothetical protein ACXWF8_13235 [Methylobacter sp.]